MMHSLAKRQRIEEAEKNEQEELEQVLNEYSETLEQGDEQDESLHSMIEQKEWHRLVNKVQELRNNNVGERIPELDEKREKIPGAQGFTPLQAALNCAVTDDTVIPVIEALADVYTVQDRHEYLVNPLHHACQFIPNPNCIRKIVDCYPAAVLEKQDGKSVFHVLLQHAPPLELVKYMAQVWAEQKGMDINTAWTEIVTDREVVEEKDNEGNTIRRRHTMLPIHYAVQEHSETDVILELLKHYSGSASATIDEKESRETTVHMAVFHGCSYQVLKALVEQSKGSLADDRGVNGRKKDTPLHLLFHPDHKDRWIKGNTNYGSMSPYKMAWFLIITHAMCYKELGVKGENPKGDPRVQAKKIIEGKGEAGMSVIELAQALEEKLSKSDMVQGSSDYKELLDIQDDFKNKIAYCHPFPNFDFNE